MPWPTGHEHDQRGREPRAQNYLQVQVCYLQVQRYAESSGAGIAGIQGRPYGRRVHSLPSSRSTPWRVREPYTTAAAELHDSQHCHAYEVSHGIEEPDNYVVRIEWDSLEGHEQGFRKSPGFAPFFAAVKPFFEQIEEMHHYRPTGIASDA